MAQYISFTGFIASSI